MKTQLSLIFSFTLAAASVTWFSQDSINAYWQQTYHQTSPLEALAPYAEWTAGAKWQQVANEQLGSLKNWAQVLADVRREVAVVQPPEYNRFANSFSHIFAGGYSAGYYSYAWAEVLSADAYAAFEESGDVRAMGAKFWNEIISMGGSRSAMENFKAFRGREPSIDALLRHSGFVA